MIDLAAESLKGYCDRHDLSAPTSCDHFVNGLMAYLAATSWSFAKEERGESLSQVEILDVAPRPSQECRDYVNRMIGAMALASHLKSFSEAVMLAAAFRHMWPEEDRDDWIEGDWALELGFCVAAEADGCGISWTDDDDRPPHGIVCPKIEAAAGDFFDTEENG